MAACGSAYTKHDFIARADAICASALRQARSIPPPILTGQAGPDSTQLGAYLGKLLPIVEAEFAQLRRLQRPPQGAGARATLAAWLQALGRDVDTFRALAAAAKDGDTQGVASAEATLSASPSNALAASYGLRDCAAPGATVR